jgi:hypothetical protein
VALAWARRRTYSLASGWPLCDRSEGRAREQISPPPRARRPLDLPWAFRKLSTPEQWQQDRARFIEIPGRCNSIVVAISERAGAGKPLATLGRKLGSIVACGARAAAEGARKTFAPMWEKNSLRLLAVRNVSRSQQHRQNPAYPAADLLQRRR